MRFFRPCRLASWLFPDAFFRGKTTEKILYLTFDDGPDPVSTPQLLDILGKYNIKAVFFCSGKSASELPFLVGSIKSAGHVVGNHGYDHLKGLSTATGTYLNDVRKAAVFTSDILFRPPYGSMKIRQYLELKKSFRIILWDVMPYDFDVKFGGSHSLKILKKLDRPGSVIVLHDSERSSVLNFIEEFILFSTRQGYSFSLP